jgi:hypothetical protein
LGALKHASKPGIRSPARGGATSCCEWASRPAEAAPSTQPPAREPAAQSVTWHLTGESPYLDLRGKVMDVSPERERLHRLVDKLPEERVGEVTDALELIAAEVMVDLQEVLQERERRIAEAYARGYGAAPQEWIGHAGLEAGAQLLKEEPRS